MRLCLFYGYKRFCFAGTRLRLPSDSKNKKAPFRVLFVFGGGEGSPLGISASLFALRAALFAYAQSRLLKTPHCGLFPRLRLPLICLTKNKRSTRLGALSFLVEARGVEPLSENLSTRLSTSVDGGLTFPPRSPRRQGQRFSSFINPACGKAYAGSFPAK